MAMPPRRRARVSPGRRCRREAATPRRRRPPLPQRSGPRGDPRSRRAAALRRRSRLRRLQVMARATAVRWRPSSLRRRSGMRCPQIMAGAPVARRRSSSLRAEAGCAACRSCQEWRWRGGDRAHFGAEAARGSGGSTPDRSRDGANSRFSSGESAPDRGAAKSRVASGRSIPAAVKREVWQRDQGCCTFVDRHTGRRCGSRFFLELDHVVPVAVGGGAEAGNLRLRCAAHHRYRHGRRQRSAPRDPVT